MVNSLAVILLFFLIYVDRLQQKAQTNLKESGWLKYEIK